MSVQKTNAQISSQLLKIDSSLAAAPKSIAYEPSAGTAGTNLLDSYYDSSNGKLYLKTSGGWVNFDVSAG